MPFMVKDYNIIKFAGTIECKNNIPAINLMIDLLTEHFEVPDRKSTIDDLNKQFLNRKVPFEPCVSQAEASLLKRIFGGDDDYLNKQLFSSMQSGGNYARD